jgi:hypothetical protein
MSHISITNPLLEDFLTRPGIVFGVKDNPQSAVTYYAEDHSFIAWANSLEENVDFQINDKQIFLNRTSEKIKKIHSIVINEPVKNLDTSITEVKNVSINASVLENLILGNLETFEVESGPYPMYNIILKGNSYTTFNLNGSILFSIVSETPNPFANTTSFSFNPNSISYLPSNKLETFLTKALESENVSIPEAVLNSIESVEIRSQLFQKVAASNQSSYYYYDNDLVGDLPNVDYKYFFNAVDMDWNNLGNWFEDAEGLIPSLTLPNVGDSIYIPNSSQVLYNGTLIFRNDSAVYGSVSANQITFAGRSKTNTGTTLTVFEPLLPNAITFNDSSRCNGVAAVILPENTYMLFNGASENRGQLSTSDIRFSGNAINAGSIFSPVKFYEYAKNNERVYGDAYFYDASYNEGTIYSNGYFYNYAQNRGNVFNGAEFDGFGFNQSEYLQTQPTILFYNEIFKQGNRLGGCLNIGNISGSANSTVFRSSAVNVGMTSNDTYCFNNTRLYAINVQSNKNLYLYDNSGFFIENGSMSNITGNIFKHFTTLESLSSYVSNSNNKFIAFSQNLSSIELQDIGGYNGAAIYGGVSAQEITLTNCNVYQTSLLIGNVTFNTVGINNNASIVNQSDITRGNKGEIRGNATFNGYSYNWRIQESFSGNNITSYPMPNNYLGSNIKELRSGWITGNATFNGNSVNGGAITGNAIFNNASKNIFPHFYYSFNRSRDGLVKGNATFNGLAALEDNKGIVEGLSTIN